MAAAPVNWWHYLVINPIADAWNNYIVPGWGFYSAINITIFKALSFVAVGFGSVSSVVYLFKYPSSPLPFKVHILMILNAFCALLLLGLYLSIILLPLKGSRTYKCFRLLGVITVEVTSSVLNFMQRGNAPRLVHTLTMLIAAWLFISFRIEIHQKEIYLYGNIDSKEIIELGHIDILKHHGTVCDDLFMSSSMTVTYRNQDGVIEQSKLSVVNIRDINLRFTDKGRAIMDANIHGVGRCDGKKIVARTVIYFDSKRRTLSEFDAAFDMQWDVEHEYDIIDQSGNDQSGNDQSATCDDTMLLIGSMIWFRRFMVCVMS